MINNQIKLEAGGVVLGLDIGGTKTAAGMVDRQGRLHSYLVEPTPAVDGEALLDFVAGLAQRAVRESGLTPVAAGVGCGGPMQYPSGVVSPLHIPVWRDFPLSERLTRRLGLPLTLDNDAKAFALGEAMFGAGTSAPNVMGMVVSTGVGSGIVRNGRLEHGSTGNAGHIGHVVVDPSGIACECGATGCLTAYASGTGLAHRAGLALAGGEASLLANTPHGEISARLITRTARQGDALSARLLAEAGRALAIAIAGAAALLDLDRVVIGGGLTQAGELLFDPLRAHWLTYARLPFTRALKIVPAGLDQRSGVVGAAALVLSGL